MLKVLATNYASQVTFIVDMFDETVVTGNGDYLAVYILGANNQGQHVSAGVYFYTFQAGVYRQTKKMILLK